MRTSHALGAFSAIACLFAAVPATSHAVLTSPETLLLDTYHPEARRGFSGPVTTTQPLAPGGFYIVRATGSYSRYLPELMLGPAPPRCGTPDPAPLVPSPGRPDSPAGTDPEWSYAYFKDTPGTPCPTPVIRTIGAFRISTGGLAGPYTHIVASNRGSAPRPDHSYTYLVEGTGAPASFRYDDNPLNDNNGVITITVTPASLPDCVGDARCETSVGTGVTPAATPAVAGQSVIAGSTGPKSCASRRRFRIRLVDSKADPIVSATVRVNGKTVKVESAKIGGRTRRISNIDLRGLPSNRFTVSITAKTRSGKVLRGTRRYFTCKVKQQGGRPKL